MEEQYFDIIVKETCVYEKTYRVKAESREQARILYDSVADSLLDEIKSEFVTNLGSNVISVTPTIGDPDARRETDSQEDKTAQG